MVKVALTNFSYPRQTEVKVPISRHQMVCTPPPVCVNSRKKADALPRLPITKGNGCYKNYKKIGEKKECSVKWFSPFFLFPEL